VDITQDGDNCGGCGVACKTSERCLNGECVTFSAPAHDGQLCARADGGLGNVCDQSCVDLQSDPTHCNFCDRPCPTGASCVFGVCSVWCVHDSDCPLGSVCDSAAGECHVPCDATHPICDSDPWNCCSGTCVDTLSDPANCSSCGSPCPAGIGCVQGQCVLPDGGTPDCLADDAQCPFGFVCVQKSSCVRLLCGPDDAQEPCALSEGEPAGFPWTACCGDACVDMISDPRNCGGCGIECPSGYCFEGSCVVSPRSNDCPESCGVGTTCADARCVDSRCENGIRSRCLAEDGAIGVCCWPTPQRDAIACADLTSDPYDCGACGIACPPGAACINGLCNGLAECGPGHQGSYCNVDAGLSFLCCPGVGCIDTSSDPQNCGGCNAACGAGEICDAGQCGAG
jgi:hypothetical protein